MGPMPLSCYETPLLQSLHAAFVAVIVIHEPLSNLLTSENFGKLRKTSENTLEIFGHGTQLGETQGQHGTIWDNSKDCYRFQDTKMALKGFLWHPPSPRTMTKKRWRHFFRLEIRIETLVQWLSELVAMSESERCSYFYVDDSSQLII